MPKAADPAEVVALHDMRIAAKRLRYILEVTGPCFGPYAGSAVKLVKDLQDLLGEIHDCDVQLPEVAAFLEELMAAGRRGGGRLGQGPGADAEPPDVHGTRGAAGPSAGAQESALRAVPRALARLRT